MSAVPYQLNLSGSQLLVTTVKFRFPSMKQIFTVQPAAAAAAATSATVAVADESPGSPAMVTQTSSFLRVVTSLEFLAGQEPHGTYLSPSLNALLSLVWCVQGHLIP